MYRNQYSLINILFNIIWFIFGGFVEFLIFAVLGIIGYLTVIGIPFGKQCFKIAGLVLSPFGRVVISNFSSYPILNILWAILLGWELALFNFFIGFLLCLTIIGIPFGRQCFKLSLLVLFPFGASI